MHSRRICLLAILALFGGAGVATGQAVEPDPGVASLKAEGLSAMLNSKSDSDPMALVAKCGSDETGGDFCSESAGPEPGHVSAAPGQRLTVRLSDGASRVRADIVKRRDGETVEQYPGGIKATVVPKSNHRRWRFRLPNKLEDSNAVLIGAAYRRPVEEHGNEIRSAYFVSKFRRPG